MSTIKFYQQNKDGKETFALVMNGENVAKKIAHALTHLGEKQRKWGQKGVRFSGFALSKPVYFAANGAVFSATVSDSLKLKLRFRDELNEADYVELVDDLLATLKLAK